MDNTIKPLEKIETKLTAVSIINRGKVINMFLMLPMINGKAKMPACLLDTVCKDAGINRGDAISIS